MALTEREQDHRHALATKWLDREARLKERGQWLALVALVAILGFCAALAAVGDTRMAGAVAIALVAAVVGIFVTGKWMDRSIETEAD